MEEVKNFAEEVAKDMIEETVQNEAKIQDETQMPEEQQKVLALVQEVVDVFTPRVKEGELTPYEVAEALAIALSGTIYSVVPKHLQKQVQIEAEKLTRKTLKSFEHQIQKTNPMFVAQLLGAGKIASYVVSHGNKIIQLHAEKRKQAAEETVKELDEKLNQ